MQSIETIFKESNLLHDRFFGESFQLPYNFDNLKIEGNDLCTYRVVNDSLSKLYDNFLYLYGLAKMASNAVPVALSAVCAVSGTSTNASWYNTSIDINQINPFSQVGWPGLDNSISNNVLYSELHDCFFMASNTKTTLCLTKFDERDSNFTVVLSASNASENSTLPFIDLRSAQFYDNHLYVLDAYYNNLYRYNLTSLLTDDIFPHALKIDLAVGGYGIFENRYKFNNPQSFCITKNIIHVLDTDNFCIKQFDKNFVSVGVQPYRSILGADQAIYIAGDENTGKIFLVTKSNTLVIFESNFSSHTIIDLNYLLTTTATFKCLFVSKAYRNCLYIVTNEDIYKIYISKPYNQIGKYSMYRFNIQPDGFLCSANVPSTLTANSDAVYTFATKNENTFLVHSLDSENFVDILSLADFAVYEKDEILVQAGEYTQTWVINKAIVKLLLNHIRLKDKIKGRFTGVYDEKSNPILDGTLYFLLDDLDLTAYQITLDHLAGNNEVLSSAVINRGLKKIYNLQQSIIDKSNTVLQSSSFFENQSVSIG